LKADKTNSLDTEGRHARRQNDENREQLATKFNELKTMMVDNGPWTRQKLTRTDSTQGHYALHVPSEEKWYYATA
jgi:hypothetical protein